MSAGHNEPKLLYSVNNIRAFHLQNGEESPLNSSGPQTLSLLMVPTSSPFADLSSTDPSSAAPEEDFYLHLNLPPELDMPLPATTQIYHQPPNSYLIPRWDLGPDSGAFTRIEFPGIGKTSDKVSQEDIDTFETILAQCTAFLERAVPPEKGAHGNYNPADYAPGEGYIGSKAGGKPPQRPGQIVLIDEDDGSVVGELQDGFQVVEGSTIRPGDKNPVEIALPAEGQGNQITVNNVSEEYLRMAKHPAYQKSTIVQTSATASRLVVTGSEYLAKALSAGADNFTKKTQSNPKPMTFTPATQARIRKINTFSQGAAGLSAKTVGSVGRYAQNFGAKMARKGEKQKKGLDKDGKPIPDYRPGILNKSMIAFSTIADGVDQGARNLLNSGSAAATTVVGHRYGPEARTVASDLAGGAKNVGLVYIDAVGVSRRAVIKSVAKGMIVGRMPNGEKLVVGAGDGSVVPQDAMSSLEQKGHAGNQDVPGTGQVGVGSPGGGQVGFGNQAPPAYGAGVGEPIGSTALQGQSTYGKQ
ncbi:MAG: hypothetical protein Q9227_000553 [Pyrenula ochraceoflavens]